MTIEHEGKQIPDSGEMFNRKVVPHMSSNREQRKRRHIGAQVYVYGPVGAAKHTVTMISVDGLAWKDENNLEHATCDILV